MSVNEKGVSIGLTFFQIKHKTKDCNASDTLTYVLSNPSQRWCIMIKTKFTETTNLDKSEFTEYKANKTRLCSKMKNSGLVAEIKVEWQNFIVEF